MHAQTHPSSRQFNGGRKPKPVVRAIAGALSCMLFAVMPLTSAQSQTVRSEQAYVPENATVSPLVQVTIIDIIARMNQAIDANDYAAYASFYHENGEIESGFGPVTKGRDAIINSLQQSAPFITNKRHVASNIVFNGTANRVTAVYYLTVFERVSGLTLAGTAVITDTFVKQSGRWQVTRHVTRMDPATLNAMSATTSQ